MKHRPYQLEALEASKEALIRKVYRQLLQLFTGGGKTVIFASVRKHFGFKNRILFIVHTEELATQAKEKLEAWNPEESVSIEMAGSYSLPTDMLVVGSVATLGRAGSTRLEAFVPSDFDAVIVDEGHHLVAESYQRILRHFGLCKGQDNEGRLLLAVTATSKRGDGRGLEECLEEIVYEFSMLKAIREGWMVNFRAFRVRTDVNLDTLKYQDGEPNQKELSLAVNTPKRNEEILARWLEVGENRKTIGFAVDIKHAQCLAQTFKDAGVKAEAVWGRDTDRAWKLARHRGPEAIIEYCLNNDLPVPSSLEIEDLLILVLFNCAFLIEGYDDWAVACIILAAPTASAQRLEQEVGRGGRLPKGINNLIEEAAAGRIPCKTDCILIDVTDNTQRHRMATVPSLVGLPPKLDMKGLLLTDVIDKVEEVRDASPETDFDDLEDLDNIQSYIEAVDLFKVEFCPEVMENSELQWHKTPRGNYLLLLPNNERITIVKNLLDTWTISGTVRGSTFQTTEPDFVQAITTADGTLKYLGRILIPSVKRETTAKSAKSPCGPAQITAITALTKRLGKGLPDFTKLTTHEAAKMLTALCLKRAA